VPDPDPLTAAERRRLLELAHAIPSLNDDRAMRAFPVDEYAALLTKEDPTWMEATTDGNEPTSAA
jgi:hypothetical protein